MKQTKLRLAGEEHIGSRKKVLSRYFFIQNRALASTCIKIDDFA